MIGVSASSILPENPLPAAPARTRVRVDLDLAIDQVDDPIHRDAALGIKQRLRTCQDRHCITPARTAVALSRRSRLAGRTQGRASRGLPGQPRTEPRPPRITRGTFGETRGGNTAAWPVRSGTAPHETNCVIRRHALAELLGKRDNDALRTADVG